MNKLTELYVSRILLNENDESSNDSSQELEEGKFTHTTREDKVKFVAKYINLDDDILARQLLKNGFYTPTEPVIDIKIALPRLRQEAQAYLEKNKKPDFTRQPEETREVEIGKNILKISNTILDQVTNPNQDISKIIDYVNQVQTLANELVDMHTSQ